MSIVTVKEVKVREEVNRKTGAVFHKQKVALKQGAYELPFDIPVSPDRPYPIGDYLISPESYRINQYGGLELNRFELALDRLKSPPAAAAAK